MSTDYLIGKTGWSEITLFAITLVNGLVLRTTSGQTDAVVSGNTYYATKYGKWERETIISEANTVTETKVTLIADPSVLFPGTSTPLIQCTKLFARAKIKMTVLYLSLEDGSQFGTHDLFVGQTTIPSINGTSATFTCSDFSYLLQKPWPTRLIQTGDPFSAFDPHTKLNKADYQVTATTASGTTDDLLVITSAVAHAAPYYSKGFITMTSGQYSGFSFTVTEQVDTTHFKISTPHVLKIAPGDTLHLYPGYDGQLGACMSKFNNLQNFGGFPFVPGPENALSGSGV